MQDLRDKLVKAGLASKKDARAAKTAERQARKKGGGANATPCSAPIVVLAAFKAELAPLKQRFAQSGTDIAFVLTGVGPQKAEATVRRQACQPASPKPQLLLSIGCCGGLSPRVPVGQLVIAEQVVFVPKVAPDPPDIASPAVAIEQAPAPDPRLTEIAQKAAHNIGLDQISGRLCTVSKPLLTRAHKDHVYRLTRAVAVDMETAAIGRVAGELGVPYLSLRVVLDPAEEDLPEHTKAVLLKRLRPLADDLARCATIFVRQAKDQFLNRG